MKFLISLTEPEEADAAESMLTLTQCSTAGSLNNGNIYIITNKGYDSSSASAAS